MTPAKTVNGRATKGIRLTPQRRETTAKVLVDMGAYGCGYFTVRPLLYTGAFVEEWAKQLAATNEDASNVDNLMAMLMPLIVDWDIAAPADEIISIFPDKSLEDLGEVVGDEDGVQLYKLPLAKESMKLFPILGDTSGTNAILQAIAGVSFSMTAASPQT